MGGNYDNSASFYDSLSRLVFGRALIQAQVYLLPQIPPNSNVLIIGGGTGWILEEITKLHPSGLNITYVEISAKMTALSRKRNVGDNQVNFINKPVQQVELNQQDVIITSFLFDNFTEGNMHPLFAHIHAMLKPGGLWLNTDFQLSGKWWQYILLKSMLLFFKVLCGVESWRLPDVAKQFNNYGYQVIEEGTFFNDFVVTKMYRKQA
ncbi:class I SAM-dependent methyltransferase [Mucilaginibacter sp.]|jgi:ubiquinone/menaquinone biosynthesis C-methylase UbiE|uniref:class I SAM-dependent methyltransferase n=1 Tax=Mucilaginibacter sp. TaxID=1882438 RepID=UPI0035638DD2